MHTQSVAELTVFAPRPKDRLLLPSEYPPSEIGLKLDFDDSSLLTPGNMLDGSTLPSSSLRSPPGSSEFGMRPIIVSEPQLVGSVAGAVPTMGTDHLTPPGNTSDSASIDGRKKRNTFVRAMKKAGLFAAKPFKGKTLTMRRERKLSKQDVRVIFQAIEAPHDAQTVDKPCPAEDPHASMDSLEAVRGSPTTLSAFPISPPFNYSGRFITPPAWKEDRHDSLGVEFLAFTLKMLFRITFFLPYVLLVGYSALLAPSCLSAVAFSPLFGFAPRPLTSISRFSYHARVLPSHVGVTCGFTAILSWRLSKESPLACAALNFAVASTIWLVWANFELTKEMRAAPLGSDDRTTIYKVYEMTVPLRLRRLLCKNGSKKAEFKNREAEDLTVDGPLDVTLPLEGTCEDYMRIVVRCED